MVYVIIIAIVIFILYNSFKGNQDIKNVEKHGGLQNKYNELIQCIMSNEKLRLRTINPNNIEIGYSFAGGGYLFFKLIEMSGNLIVRYESKDFVDGVKKLAWKFNENDNQTQMFEKISKDLAIHNFMLSGLSRKEATEAVQEILEEQKQKSSQSQQNKEYIDDSNEDYDLPF